MAHAASAEPTGTQRHAGGGPVIGRRQLLGGIAAGAVGVGLGAGAATTGLFGLREDAAATTGPSTAVVPFYGAHQAGIATPVQGHLHFAAYDVITDSREDLNALLRRWTSAAAAMCAGDLVGDNTGQSPLAPPDDNGESLGLPAARLTITIGFGPSLFDERFGFAAQRPAALVDLPHFAADALDPAKCGGDLAIQACADDPQVAVHAIRMLTRLAAGTASVRWAQLGYGSAASTSPDQPTPRNLFGFKDGTANPSGNDDTMLNEQVWVGDSDSASADGGSAAGWMAGGSYLVSRRISMRIETWDRTSLTEQETIIGRTKVEGAPLGQSQERDPINVAQLPVTSHVAIAHPSNHGGAILLRRGYNFVNGSDGLGHLDAGLFFLAYQRDPRRQFIPIQTALARSDAMNEYLQHTGSAIWAVPPGIARGGYWGDTLFA